MLSKETITHHFFVSGGGQKKTVVQPKFVAAQKILLKQKLATFVNGLLGAILLGIYTPLEARVCIAHNNCMSCPSYGQLYLHFLINILLGSFQLFA